MKCLVLGGNGFIGSHLVDKLVNARFAVRVLDKYPERYRAPLIGVEYIYEDTGNRGIITESLKDIDIVFHLVSTTTPKTSNDDTVFDVQSNLVSTLYLLDQCVKQQIKKIVFTSSGGTVYGVPDKLPISEDHTLDPISSYGIVKLTIEKYLQLYHRLYGLEYRIIRPSNPYGERQNPDGIQGAISVFLGKIAKNESIEIWGDGTIVRDFIYVKDLVDGIFAAATKNTDKKIFNLGSGKGHSINDLLEIIKNAIDPTSTIEYKEGRVFDVPAIYLDIERAKQELDWIPQTSIHEGVIRTWKFIQSLK